jgi:hypothetical protein
MNKFSLVVEVRLIKGKIDHPPIFKKIRYFSDPDRVFRLGSQKYHNTRRFLCKKNGRKMLGNNFKTILKEERWSKLPTFTVPDAYAQCTHQFLMRMLSMRVSS